MSSAARSRMSDIHSLVKQEAEKLFHLWMKDEDLTDIEAAASAIAMRARDMTIFTTLIVYPLALFTLILVAAADFATFWFITPWGLRIPIASAITLPVFRLGKTYLTLGAITKRKGIWKRGTILIKPGLAEARRRVLAIHEVLHSAIALNFIPQVVESPNINEEVIATAIETIRAAELEGGHVIKNSPAALGSQLYEAVQAGRIPIEHMETILRAASSNPTHMGSLDAINVLIRRMEAFQAGVAKWANLRNGTISFEQMINGFEDLGAVGRFGLAVGWAKLHGLLLPEIETRITALIAGEGEPTEQQMHEMVGKIVALQAGMWCGQLEKSGKIDKSVSRFITELYSISLITPYQAYDVARRTVEGEYDRTALLAHLERLLGESSAHHAQQAAE
jgi:hypothetical protein